MPSIAPLLLMAVVAQAQDANPAEREVVLAGGRGFTATLAFATDVGVWSVVACQVRPELGCPELVALDDRGRATVLVSYSGKWTPQRALEDGRWLGAAAHGDVDPRRPGDELYVAGKSGNVYRIVPRGRDAFDSVEIAHFAGDEVHTLVAADLRPQRPGLELWAFTVSGDLWELRSGSDDGFATERIACLPGRVRDAVVVPSRDGGPPSVAIVSRAQEVALLRVGSDGAVSRRTVLHEPMGFGRIARRSGDAAGALLVLYVTRDDGVVLRLEETPEGGFVRELVYAGPQGPRGLVAGRFVADPSAETIAVFGYSGKVQLLERIAPGAWRVSTVFTDVERGHWLCVTETDGRNCTDEIVGCGYGGRVFVLARPPGFGLDGVATDPDAEPSARDAPPGRARVREPRSSQADADGGRGSPPQRRSRARRRAG